MSRSGLVGRCELYSWRNFGARLRSGFEVMTAGKLRFETFKVFRVPSPIRLDIAIYC